MKLIDEHGSPELKEWCKTIMPIWKDMAMEISLKIKELRESDS